MKEQTNVNKLDNKLWGQKLFRVITAIIGAFFIGFAALSIFNVLFGNTLLRLQYNTRVDCVCVTRVENKIEEKGKGFAIKYAPVYEYTYDGKTYEYTEKRESGYYDAKVGDKLVAYINEEKPDVIYIADPIGGKITMCIVALFSAMFGGVFLFISRRINENIIEKSITE